MSTTPGPSKTSTVIFTLLVMVAIFLVGFIVTIFFFDSSPSEENKVKQVILDYSQRTLNLSGPTPCSLMTKEFKDDYIGNINQYNQSKESCREIFLQQRRDFSNLPVLDDQEEARIIGSLEEDLAKSKIIVKDEAAAIIPPNEKEPRWLLRKDGDKWLVNERLEHSHNEEVPTH